MTLYCLGVELVQASSFKVDQGEHGAAEAVSSNTPDVEEKQLNSNVK